MCSTCLTSFPPPSAPLLSKSCPSCHSLQFCNRLCLSRSKINGAHPDLLCPALNPGCSALLIHIQKFGTRHLDAVARIISLWLGFKASGDEKGMELIKGRVWGGMARVNQLEKEKERREWYVYIWHLDIFIVWSVFAPVLYKWGTRTEDSGL